MNDRDQSTQMTDQQYMDWWATAPAGGAMTENDLRVLHMEQEAGR